MRLTCDRGRLNMDVLAVVVAAPAFEKRTFSGRTQALHALEQARAAHRVVRVCLVTADSELARQAADAGAEVIAPAADDERAALLRSALEAVAERSGFAPALAVLLDAAYPLCETATIDAAVEHLLRCGADSLVAVSPLDDALWVQDETGTAQPIGRRASEQRYVETKALSAVRVGVFEGTGELPTGRVVLFEVPALAALRVEQDLDWHRAESLARRLSRSKARALLRRIRLLVLDFDGVMTDNRVLVLEDGREAVLCSRGDGMGIGLLKAAGVPVAVISKEINPVVGARCRKLGIPYLQGIDDKLTELRRVAAEHRVELADTAFIGNDVNDLACMEAAGVAIAPADAHPEALRAAALVTTAAGGAGAVRELCDLLLDVREHTQAEIPAA
jgi:N-acylneuraminate cytidylyltransferase